MEIKQQINADAQARPIGLETVACPNCQAYLVRGMRFCRQCGYRLGEGVAEFIETMRLDGTPPAPIASYASPTAPQPVVAQTSALAPVARRSRARWSCSGRRANWLIWPLMLIILTTASSGAWVGKMPFWQSMFGLNSSNVFTPRSFFGTLRFTTVEGGAMMSAVVPNGPAEHAGLIGGDIVTRFDGHEVTGNNDMTRLLRSTPVGKAVEVVFLRDGEQKVATLVTASPDDFNMADNILMGLTGEQGFLGIDGDYNRVPVPDTNLYGVQLDDILKNRPADIAGLRSGDIVIEFNGTPIRTTAEFEARIHRAHPGDLVNVVVMRGGERLEIPVKMGRR